MSTETAPPVHHHEVEVPEQTSIVIPTKWLLPVFAFMLGGGGGSVLTMTADDKGNRVTSEEVDKLKAQISAIDLKVETVRDQQNLKLDDIKNSITALTIEVRTKNAEGVR